MMKGMMGPEHGAKAVFGSAKAGQTMRQKRGGINTVKLPTSLTELHETMGMSPMPQSIVNHQRPQLGRRE